MVKKYENDFKGLNWEGGLRFISMIFILLLHI